jgi:DDE superfamily endonuclease
LPHKKKRVAKGESNELSEEQKAQNKELGQERIFVEHSIGGMKRYRILEHRNRVKSKKVIDQIIGVCAGLWNFTF